MTGTTTGTNHYISRNTDNNHHHAGNDNLSSIRLDEDDDDDENNNIINDDKEFGRFEIDETKQLHRFNNGIHTEPTSIHRHERKRTTSTTNHNDGRSSNHHLGGKETKAVSLLRLVVLAVLVVSATCTAIAVYFYTRNSELRSFEMDFYSDAENIIHGAGHSLYITLSAIDSYAAYVMSQARATNQSFPFVTTSDAHIHMAKLGSIGHTQMIQQAHFVSSSQQRIEWENYTTNNNQWINDSIQQQNSDTNNATLYIDPIQNFSSLVNEGMIHTYDGPSSNNALYLPTWQSFPIVPGWSIYNFDALTYGSVNESLNEIVAATHAILGPPTFPGEQYNFPMPFTNDDDDDDDYSFRIYEPLSVIFYPIVDTTNVVPAAPVNTSSADRVDSVVGILSVYLYWKDLVQDALSESGGLFLVIENECNRTFTYEINGPSIRFMGMGDMHDPAFSHMVQSYNLNDLKQFSQDGRKYTGLPFGENVCPYTLSIYPTVTLENEYKSSKPAIFAVSAVLIFLFTSAVFLIYDLCVEKRQQKVMNSAIQSSENVSLLESMVRERTRKLEETNCSLAKANRRVTRASAAQLEHFACMSHEIRTPLNCIIGLSSLLLDTELNAMQEESMRMIVTSGDLLLTVVNDVLDYSKLESGNVELSITRSNLQDTLSAVVQSIEARARPKMLSIRTSYDPRICEYGLMDCRRLQQILYNLLGNALKFSNSGGSIDLTVTIKDAIEVNTEGRTGHTYMPKSEDHEVVRSGSIVVFEDVTASLRSSAASRRSSKYKLHYDRSSMNTKNGHAPGVPFQHCICFVVKDCGKGIERKDFQKIFEPFRQASAETERVYGGTGLGLAVTAKLVTALGGTVSVDSCQGEWTEFTVQLPYRDAPFRVDEVAQRLVHTVVFLIDDDPANVLAISNLFQECGINSVSYKCMEDLVCAAATLGYIRSQNTYICLVNESLYDSNAYNALTDQARLVLLSFGPKFSVKETQYHYRSLTQVLPSVLLTSFASFVDALNNNDESLTDWNSPKPSGTAKTSLQRSSGTFTMEDIRIMMAEDNKINQKVLLRILNRLGYLKIDIVENGKEACDLEETQYYDIILMDVQMPVMSGIEACQIIMNRTSTVHPKPKIVFVTAHVSDAFEAECRTAGGADFLPKPFNISDIQNCLQRNLPTIS